MSIRRGSPVDRDQAQIRNRFFIVGMLFGLAFLAIYFVYVERRSTEEKPIYVRVSWEDLSRSKRRNELDPEPSRSPNAALDDFDAFGEFSLSPAACPLLDPPFAIMFVESRPNAVARRQTIRNTYGMLALNRADRTDKLCDGKAERMSARNQTIGVLVYFVVGQVDDPLLQESIDGESREYADVIQSEAFVDDYNQLTRKGLSALHWSLKYCPGSQFAIKTDDDTWVNIPLLLSTLTIGQEEQSIFGYKFVSAAVNRDSRSKWSVPEADYAKKYYPNYVSGTFYAVHMALVPSLLQAATKLKFLVLEDVFITGLAAKEAGISHVNWDNVDFLGKRWDKPCSKRALLAIHYVDDKKMLTLWNDQCHWYKVPC